MPAVSVPGAAGGLAVSYYTAPGPRPRNEDWIGGYLPADARWRTAKGGCFVVADGVGGHQGGAVASRVAGETVLHAYYQAPSHDVGTALGQALLAAHQRVSDAAARTAGLEGMASTVVAAALRGSEAAVAHLGDSRGILLRNNTLYRLTRDHSWVQDMVDSQVLTPQQAAGHPYRNVLTRYVGMRDPARPDVRRVQLLPGDALLLVTDGVTDRVSAPELGRLVDGSAVRDPAGALVRRASALGTRDNASAVVIRYQPWGAARPRPVNHARAGSGDTTSALLYGGALVLGGTALGLLLATLLG